MEPLHYQSHELLDVEAAVLDRQADAPAAVRRSVPLDVSQLERMDREALTHRNLRGLHRERQPRPPAEEWEVDPAREMLVEDRPGLFGPDASVVEPFGKHDDIARKAIAEDEMGHGPEQVQRFVEDQIKSEQDLEIAARALTAIMAQHLRVRNEIYGNPIGPERLAAIDRGEIEAWAIPAAAPA